ncbi:TPA: hypothetical protein I7730_00170 [Vibrio vulnificus]|uniref:Uncharacterized protein n=1 Tax=Vibrio vulnificus TaxID=672 RepID=A0A8H9MY83_VIBVL|nr:hypothetical protein [Vibrio vulnificus]HAS8538213.1 hypothetical protein [Vibrio vulnificus]
MIKITVNNIESAVEKLDAAFNEKGYAPYRCLAATTVLASILRNSGWNVELFPCSTKGVSKKFYEYVSNGVHAKSVEEAERWAAEGARIQEIRANSTEADLKISKPLEGHLCLVANIGDSYMFIDPSFGQFNRTEESHGWTLLTDNIMLAPIGKESFDLVARLNKMNTKEYTTFPDEKPSFQMVLDCDGVFCYEYDRILQLEKMKKKPSSKLFKTSDAFLPKHNTVIKLFERKMAA